MFEFSIIIPWRTDGGRRQQIFDWVLSRYQSYFPDAEICIGEDDSVIFNRSRARNKAFEKSTKDYILLADADAIFDPWQIVHGFHAMESTNRWVLPYQWYYNLTEEYSNRLLQGDSRSKIPEPTEALYDHKIESWASLLLIKRDWYKQVGGYDERFVGWGYEDNAFRAGLDKHVGQYVRLGGHFCAHLWHPYGEYEGFDSPYIEHNRKLYQEYLTNG